jgi:hypothetical protein
LRAGGEGAADVEAQRLNKSLVLRAWFLVRPGSFVRPWSSVLGPGGHRVSRSSCSANGFGWRATRVTLTTIWSSPAGANRSVSRATVRPRFEPSPECKHACGNQPAVRSKDPELRTDQGPRTDQATKNQARRTYFFPTSTTSARIRRSWTHCMIASRRRAAAARRRASGSASSNGITLPLRVNCAWCSS